MHFPKTSRVFYGIRFYGVSEVSNVNRIQTFRSKRLRRITQDPFYVSVVSPQKSPHSNSPKYS